MWQELQCCLKWRETATLGIGTPVAMSSHMERPNRSALIEEVVGCAIEVHKVLGPGLLESAYDECLAHELHAKGLEFRRHVAVPVLYKGMRLNYGFRADYIVREALLLELKSVDAIAGIHYAQVLTYLRLTGLRHGLLLNFNSIRLVQGMRSIVL